MTSQSLIPWLAFAGAAYVLYKGTGVIVQVAVIVVGVFVAEELVKKYG